MFKLSKAKSNKLKITPETPSWSTSKWSSYKSHWKDYFVCCGTKLTSCSLSLNVCPWKSLCSFWEKVSISLESHICRTEFLRAGNEICCFTLSFSHVFTDSHISTLSSKLTVTFPTTALDQDVLKETCQRALLRWGVTGSPWSAPYVSN